MELPADLVAYLERFFSGDRERDRNIALKRDHTRRVLQTAEKIAAEEKLPEDAKKLLLRAALLHDVSRFEQFARYGTFRDAISFDHGERSAVIAEKEGFLCDLDAEEKRDVLFAVRYHNKVALPEAPSPRAELIARLVRDADKLDIFHILLDHLEAPSNPAIVWQLPERGEVSETVAAELLNGRSPDNRDFASSLDFAVAKAGWVFDLNSSCVKAEFVRLGLLDKLGEKLPSTPLVTRILAKAKEHLKA